MIDPKNESPPEEGLIKKGFKPPFRSWFKMDFRGGNGSEDNDGN